ncbi:thymic stromal cotransporter homolog isoform X1 [Hypanus sabinus]|uniref:thymic stromal cotransporter homolog isoform X1 n=1 Tax=Hypanus sabinus TaxID=79690 RepID=UPI0028C3E50F|nr:thymic stromal cotransporter homolog isoform X1 [Hypanus sabinus]
MCEKLPSLLEIVVVFHQVAGAFFDTGLLMVAQERCNATVAGVRQTCISQFYMCNNIMLGLTPLLFTFILAKLGDERSRKITICVPLLGYLISRSLLFCVILFHLPLEVMFATALLNGLSGGFPSFWSGIMALASDTSSAKDRSVRLIRIELAYGLAGLIGSLSSGHIFIHFTLSHDQGVVLAGCSCLCYLISLLYCLLGVKAPSRQAEACEQIGSTPPLGSDRVLGQSGWDHGSEAATRVEAEQNRGANRHPTETSRLLDYIARAKGKSSCCTAANFTVALLFTSGVLYDLSVTGGVDIIPMFVLKDPLNWDAVWVGYGSAAGYTIFLTSFLGVKVLSRYLKDTSLIVIGIVSFSTGMLIMAFVKRTYVFFIARAVMLFALIPLPTIRSLISKHIKETSYGKVLAVLQIIMTLAGVTSSISFIQIYLLTKDWYPNLCFSLSSVIGCLSIIPIILVERRSSEQSGYSRIPED